MKKVLFILAMVTVSAQSFAHQGHGHDHAKDAAKVSTDTVIVKTKKVES